MRTIFTGAARAALLLTACRAFYLPGVAPRTFRYGDKVELKVNKLTSVHTQIPYDYYSLKFCRPRGGIKQATENLGEVLSGDLIENSPYHLFMEQDQFCKVLCQVSLNKQDVASLKTIITKGRGGECAHTTRIGAAVAFPQALMVLTAGQRKNRLPVTKRDKTQLGAFKAFLKDHPSTSLTKPPLKAVTNSNFCGGTIRRHRYAFARC